MDKLKYAIDTLTQLREEVGTSYYDQAIKILNRQRLDSSGMGREKRKPISWAVIKRHYNQQRGICRWCYKPMVLLRSEVEGDHVDPNAVDFNNDKNIQVLHRSCNRGKSAMSIEEQAKHLGKTYREILEPEI